VPLASVDDELTSPFEVVLLVPSQDFLNLPRSAEPNAEGFLELPLPSQLSDAVHDLKAIITESPEGFWLGSFGLKPIVSEEIKPDEQPTEGEQAEIKWGPWVDMVPPSVDPEAGPVDPKMWRLTNEGVLGDYADLSAVFGGSFEGKRRGLKVVPSELSF
jgi:protein TIF31